MNSAVRSQSRKPASMAARHVRKTASVLACAALLALAGCATVEIMDPEDSVSADYQKAVSSVIEADAARVPLPTRDVTVQVSLLAWDDDFPAGIESYIKSVIREGAANSGARVSAAAPVALRVFVFSAGDMTTDRSISLPLRNISLQIPLFYSARTDVLFEMVFVIEDREKGTRKAITSRKGLNFSDAYLLRMFGPYDLGI